MPSKPIAVFFADAHIDVHNWASHPGLAGDSMWAFSYVCEQARKKGVKDIFCAGDVFDTRKPPTECVQFMRQQMNCLEDAGVRFYYVQGQHDMADPPWLGALHDWPVHLHKDVAVLENREAVYGLDWLPAARLEGALNDIPPTTDIFVGHQVWDDFMGDVAVCEGSFGMVRYATRVFTGDYHRMLHWTPEDTGLRGKDGQQLEIISPGATNLRAINETRYKYYCVYYDDSSWHFRKIPQRPVHDLEVRSPDDVDSFIRQWDELLNLLVSRADKDGLPPHLRSPILYVKYLESVPDSPARIDYAVGGQAFTFYKAVEVVSEEAEKRRASVREILDRGLSGCLSLVVKKKDPRYKPLATLINSMDQAATLAELRGEYISNEDRDDGNH